MKAIQAIKINALKASKVIKAVTPGVLAILALAVAVAVVWWLMRHRRREGFDSPPTIFLSIASYRDDECAATLQSLFETADHPERLTVGVCEQNSGAVEEVCLNAGFKWHDRVRRVSLPAREAKGPTYARYLCSTLYRGEDFFCQIDSHMRFVKGWDAAVAAMWTACGSDKAILTHYPHDTVHMDKPAGKTSVPIMCKSKFDGQGLPTFEASSVPAGGSPRRAAFVAGGFIFGPGRMVRDVPFDPDLPHLFQGEEILLSARLWTAGYDFYTPTANLAFHHYYRKDQPKFWNDMDYAAEQKRTVKKVIELLQGRKTGYPYGMGTARSLDDYYAYAGIDWASRSTSTEAAFCP